LKKYREKERKEKERKETKRKETMQQPSYIRRIMALMTLLFRFET